MLWYIYIYALKMILAVQRNDITSDPVWSKTSALRTHTFSTKRPGRLIHDRATYGASQNPPSTKGTDWAFPQGCRYHQWMMILRGRILWFDTNEVEGSMWNNLDMANGSHLTHRWMWISHSQFSIFVKDVIFPLDSYKVSLRLLLFLTPSRWLKKL